LQGLLHRTQNSAAQVFFGAHVRTYKTGPFLKPPVDTRDDESLVSRVLSTGYGWLRFPEPIESEFRRDHLQAARRWVRMSVWVAVGTSVGFALLDPFVIHARNAVPSLVRFGLQLPILAIVLVAISNQRFYSTWYERLVQVGVPLFGFGTVLMACYAESQHQALVGARLLLVVFFCYFMCGLRLRPALGGNLIILATLLAAGAIGQLPGSVALYLSFAMFCATIIGAAGAYALEHANRTSFLERKLLVEVAELDGLTRLLNRQTFESRVHIAWQQAVKAQRAVTVLMIDVDHFKLFNDHYGHQAGDECLRKVANAVRTAACSRPEDFVARYGGEEIIALIVDRRGPDTHDVAQRIVAEVAALQIAHAHSTDSRVVSVSVGAATVVPPFTSSYDAVAKLADGALYTAKRQGRNRSVVVEARASAAA
jgi:diguanylate cyclase (GGDEF)-like protein